MNSYIEPKFIGNQNFFFLNNDESENFFYFFQIQNNKLSLLINTIKSSRYDNYDGVFCVLINTINLTIKRVIPLEDMEVHPPQTIHNLLATDHISQMVLPDVFWAV